MMAVVYLCLRCALLDLQVLKNALFCVIVCTSVVPKHGAVVSCLDWPPLLCSAACEDVSLQLLQHAAVTHVVVCMLAAHDL